MDPVLPVLDVPVLRMIDPLDPVVPALALRSSAAPLLDVDP
jgi:hypothetical protein